jgi:hypothetical protein
MFHTEDTQILGDAVKKLAAGATCCPRFVHPFTTTTTTTTTTMMMMMMMMMIIIIIIIIIITPGSKVLLALLQFLC